MTLNPFHRRAARLGDHRAEQTEHEAAIELLVLAEFADRLITVDEQETIEAFTDSHGWDTPAFSYESYHGFATAKVRAAIGSREHEDALLHDISRRITDARLREELAGALGELLPGPGADGPGGADDLPSRIRAAVS
jgi:hypothetical protein